MGIVEKFNNNLTKNLFQSQNASNLLTLHMNKISRAWVRNLPIVVKYINDFITCQLGISLAMIIEKEEVFAKPFYSRNGPISFDEEKLSRDMLVRYLIDTRELEGERYCIGDLN